MKNSPLIRILTAIAILGLAACEKYHHAPDHLAGTGYIRGRLYIADSLSGVYVPETLAGAEVMLSDTDEGIGYIWKATTDAEGYFIFEHLEEGKTYSLFAQPAKDDIVFYNRLQVVPNRQDVVLQLAPKTSGQTGVGFRITDSLDNPIPGATVCLFANYLNPIDTVCDGSLWSETTNANGRVAKTDLAAGRYSAVVRYVAANGVRFFALDTFTLTPDQLLYRRITLRRAAAIQTNSITYLVTDSAGGILSGVTACGFTSTALANDSCHFASWSTTTDNEGRASVKTLPGSTYYVFFRLSFGTQLLRGTDTVRNLTNTTQYSRMIVLKH